MNIFEALILGIVEGVTEFLPVSSTGHLIMTAHALGVAQSDFVKTFEIAIQLGAIASVVFLYWRTLLARKELIKNMLIAFVPTAALGAVLYPIIKNVLLESVVTVLWALALGGVFIIAFERWRARAPTHGKELYELTARQSFLIGAIQAMAFVPGVSRAAATIVGGLASGLSKKAAVEFSFLLAVPTMFGATAFDIFQNADTLVAGNSLLLGIGFISAFFVSILAMRFLVRFIERHSLMPFGIYRIAAAVLFALIVL